MGPSEKKKKNWKEVDDVLPFKCGIFSANERASVRLEKDHEFKKRLTCWNAVIGIKETF